MRRVKRIMITDDHRMVREGLSLFIKAFKDFLFVGAASSGDEAIRLCEETQPDVILMDIVMPGMDGIEAIRHIRSKHPNIRIIALSSFSNDQNLVEQALLAGASCCLHKQVSVEELVQAIRAS